MECHKLRFECGIDTFQQALIELSYCSAVRAGNHESQSGFNTGCMHAMPARAIDVASSRRTGGHVTLVIIISHIAHTVQLTSPEQTNGKKLNTAENIFVPELFEIL